MTNTRTIEIAFEIAKAFVYGDEWQNNTFWCERCRSLVPTVTPTIAAMLDKSTTDGIRSRVESGELHDVSGPGRDENLCLGSLIDPDNETAGFEPVRDTNTTPDRSVRFICLSPVGC